MEEINWNTFIYFKGSLVESYKGKIIFDFYLL